MNLDALASFKDEIVRKFEDASFISTFMAEDMGGVKEVWAKGPAKSPIPYELELAGVTPCKFLAKEPAIKKNAHRYLYDDNARVKKVDIYSARGEPYEVEHYIYEGCRIYALKTNRHGENLWLKAVEYDQDQISRACRVDMDAEFWSFQYEWSERSLQEILTFSSNSVPGVKIYPEYRKNLLVGLYFMRGEERVYIYKVV